VIEADEWLADAFAAVDAAIEGRRNPRRRDRQPDQASGRAGLAGL
jgi:hypothetical protein